MENIIYSLMRCKGRFSLIVRNRKIFVQLFLDLFIGGYYGKRSVYEYLFTKT